MDRKAIFITGGASGIGRAIAQRFAKEGWFVGLGDVNEKGMVETQHLIGLGFSFGHTFDVRDRDAWDEALNAFSMASGGRIDVVANNAGLLKPTAALDANEENLGETEKNAPHRRCFLAAAFAENDLQREGFKLFLPGTEGLAHPGKCA